MHRDEALEPICVQLFVRLSANSGTRPQQHSESRSLDGVTVFDDFLVASGRVARVGHLHRTDESGHMPLAEWRKTMGGRGRSRGDHGEITGRSHLACSGPAQHGRRPH